MKKLLPALLAAVLMAACSPSADPEEPGVPVQPLPPEPEPEPEPGPEPPKTLEISISSPYLDLYPREKTTIKYTLSGNEFDPSKEYKVLYESSNLNIATIDHNGVVTARTPGSVVIRVTEIDSEIYAERKIYVVNLNQIKAAYDPERKFTCGDVLYYKSVVQSWDFFNDYLYACQVCGSPHTLSFTRKPVHAQNPRAYMHLKYYGHGDNIFVERADDGDWLWVSNYGTLESGQTNRYTDSQVLSRVRFTEGLTIQPAEANYNFVLPGMKRLIAAYDSDNRSVGIWCRNSSGKAWLYVYDIDTLKSAPTEIIQLSYNIEYGNPVVKEKPIIHAVNLAKLTPLLHFQMPMNNVPQGFDWHHGKIWYFSGNGAEADEVAAGTGQNWATAYLIDSEGKKLVTASVPWVTDLKLLASAGITDLGYFEPEGIKVKDGVLYIGFASKDAGSSPERRLNIFKYPLD